MATAMTTVSSPRPLGTAIALALFLGSTAAWANPEHYAARCAACHDTPPDGKTPAVDAVKRMNGVRVRHALTRGNMHQHVEDLSRSQVEALIDHVVGDQATLIPDSAYCGAIAAIAPKIARWGYDERNTRWQRDTSIHAGTPWPDCRFHFAFSAAVSIAGNVVLAGALDGRVFAFDRRDGAIRWEFATKRSFETVNGIDGHGGAIDNPGVLAVDDLVLVTSGYGMFGQMPGNVLLVFELDSSLSSAGQARNRGPAPAG